MRGPHSADCRNSSDHRYGKGWLVCILRHICLGARGSEARFRPRSTGRAKCAGGLGVYATRAPVCRTGKGEIEIA